MRSLNKELRALVSAQVPLLTEQALQRIMDELLSSLEYSQKVAEVGLQEASDDLKVELQLEKDKGIEEIDEHAQETLTDVKSQMEDLANGHLLAFEDMLQQTGEQLKQTLQVLLEVLAKAIRMGKERHDDQADAPQSPLHSPAATATKLFLHEFGDLCTTAKVKVLDRLASQHTAEIFLTVDAELREAWIASWTGQP
jgi:O6-methylguanine-DNA--protein-cysteine methyltransferase